MAKKSNKRKILNDPVYGFVTIPNDLVYELIEHPYYQRLRRIKQLGLTDFVYPGALHSRFQHAIGAMHLMGQALDALANKGTLIMDVEREAAQVAILLHDIGHGPFSHVLEYSILDGISHEKITELVMDRLNVEFNGALQMAIEMFKNSYSRPFFHQLISSQLDVDRMDYINRDSYFTGVVEGQIGVERIIKMLSVSESEELLVEEKGLLSVENFLNARRMMYWQVYLHKTAISAEVVLIKAIERVKELLVNNVTVFCPSYLRPFLEKRIGLKDFNEKPELLDSFLEIDDADIWFSMKNWKSHPDKILSFLASSFLGRKLFKIKFIENSNEEGLIKEKLLKEGIRPDELSYYYHTGNISNSGYVPEDSNIKIRMKSGEVIDVAEASDLPTIKALGKIVKKQYLCWANDVYL